MQSLLLSQFEFDKKGRFLKIASECFAGTFPDAFEVVSNHTGRIICFKIDQKAAVRNEFWDGEQMEYIPTEQLQNIDKVVIYHAW